MCQPGRKWDLEAVRWVPAQGGVAEGAGWVGMAVAGLGRGMDCPSQEEGRGVIKAGLQKSEGFCRDAALGKPEGFTPGMGRLRERGLGGGSHPG